MKTGFTIVNLVCCLLNQRLNTSSGVFFVRNNKLWATWYFKFFDSYHTALNAAQLEYLIFSAVGSSYYNLNKVLAKFFDKIEGANIETNSLDARKILENTNLEPNENLISLDVKSLYTNFPVKKAIDIALLKLYDKTKHHQ